MRRMGLLAVALAGTAFALVAIADDRPEPGTREPAARTVAQIQAKPVADERVTLSGRIVKRLDANDYVLDDGTGEILIDGGPLKHHTIDLPTGEKVRITGDVGVGPNKPERLPEKPSIDLYTVTRADGNVIRVRTGAKPAWGGSEPTAPVPQP